MLKQFLQSPFTRYCRSKVGWILGPAQQVQGSERVKLIKAWGRSRNLAIWRIGFLVTVAYGFQLLTVFKKELYNKFWRVSWSISDWTEPYSKRCIYFLPWYKTKSFSLFSLKDCWNGLSKIYILGKYLPFAII